MPDTLKFLLPAFLPKPLLTTISRMSWMSFRVFGEQICSLMTSTGYSLTTSPFFLTAFTKRGRTIFPPLAMAL